MGAHPKEGQLDHHQLTLLVMKIYFSSSTAVTAVVRRSPKTEGTGNARTRMEEFDSHVKKIAKMPS